MARRNGMDGATLIALVVLFALPLWLLSKVVDSIGGAASGVGVVLILALIVFYFIRKRAARLAYLRSKYGDEAIVQGIMRRTFWQGQTMEQLQDSLGAPPSVDNNLLKTKKREVWKYQPNGVNRYRLRITLDNDVVVGWDQKN
jgi:thiol:disulfide interchange protein